jgi:Subtilase family
MRHFTISVLIQMLSLALVVGTACEGRDNPPPTESSGTSRKGETLVWDWTEGPDSPAALRRDGNWGQKFVRFPAAWNFYGVIQRARPNGRINVGILDVGFAPHEDLEFVVNAAMPLVADNHGNHVAGIIGAKSGNAIGVDGGAQFARLVVANLRRTPTPERADGLGIAFSNILASLNDLIESRNDLKVINLGLGFNWMSNFQRDPTRDGEVRTVVETMGRIARSLADRAASRKIVLVCAAGNDSGPETKADAQWGSPFNWAAKNKGDSPAPSDNIIIVESIGRDGSHSVFSNIHGDVSAPGEDILSTFALDNFGRVRSDVYGVMSGTAMATAQVTALIAQIYAYNPDLNPDRVVAIVKSTARPAPDGSHAPTIDAFAAMLECYEGDRPLHDLADLDHNGRVDMADFLIFKNALHQVEGSPIAPPQDLNGDGVVGSGSQENVWPIYDLNGSGKLSRDANDRRPVKGNELSDLEVMMRVWEDPNFKAADLSRSL